MRSTVVAFAVMVAVLAMVSGCAKMDSPIAPLGALSTLDVGGVNGQLGVYCTDLTAGQNITAGTVCVEVIDNGDTEQLCFTYTTTDGWELVEAHLAVATTEAGIPQNRKGNPKIGNFPHHSGDITGATTYTFCVDLNTEEFGGEIALCDGELYAAAHAVVARDTDGDGVYDEEETGWGNGQQMVDGGSWAMVFGITFTCGGIGYGYSNETAFAYDCWEGLCFRDIADDINRWGWTNGPYGPGVYSLEIYAGAGQCDISKGTLVGLLTVAYDGSTATVTYSTCGEYTMTETHLYVGNEILAYDNDPDDPGFTVAPGQYPYIHEELANVQEDVYMVAVTGDIYVVAHAVVWGDYAQGDCGTRGGQFNNVAFEASLDNFVGDDGIVTLTVYHQGGNSNQPYFLGSLDGSTGLPFYCIDLANTIYSNREYCAQLYSTYDDNLPPGVNIPGSLDEVNYILNTYSIGDLALVDNLPFTGGDIQRALWKLAYGTLPGPGLYSSGVSSTDRVDELLAAAAANGDGYEPPCGGVVGVVAYPVDCDSSVPQQNLIAQVLVTEFDTVCRICP